MQSREYRFNAGQYVFHVNGTPTTRPADTVALAIDTDEGTLHKHGNPESVSDWYVKTRQKLREAGCETWADRLVVIEGRFPLDEINKCISAGGYGKFFLDKLLRDEISPVPYGPGASDVPPQQNQG